MSEKKNFFRASAEDFKKIPGEPVAYWLQDSLISAFRNFPSLYSVAPTKQGLATGDNDRFLRRWFEIAISRSAKNFFITDPEFARKKWFLCNKGGEFRKWYGNFDFVVNWDKGGVEIKSFYDDRGKLRSRPQNESYYYKEGLTWSAISSGNFAMRYSPSGVMFETKGAMCFPSPNDIFSVLAFLNSCVVRELLLAMAPTLDFHEGPVGRLPYKEGVSGYVIPKRCIEIEHRDWDSFETSWDFEVNPLVAMRQNPVNPVNPVEKSGQLSVASGQEEETAIATAHRTLPTDHSSLPTAHSSLAALYAQLRRKWAADCEEMRRLEMENNRIFIEAYGLQDELTPEVSWDEITLTCNPWYRYNAKCGMRNEELGGTLPKDAELEKRLMADTVKELISYAVGCMMGRYSLDKPGLILADQGSTIADYYEKVGSGQLSVGSRQKGDAQTDHCPLPTVHFSPDEDGIIPVLDNDWFADDIVTRFKEFIKVAFGEEHFFENMTWIEDALGKDIRSYFTKDFYKDHLQRYQNRPIYWLFQSPKGAFRALVYMHRYKPDMVGGVLGYLRSLQTKVENQLNVAMQIGMDESKDASERVRANKDAVKYAKAKKELDEYERNVLYPLSTERIEIDLDDGVKVNYRKFGSALRKVVALEAKGE